MAKKVCLPSHRLIRPPERARGCLLLSIAQPRIVPRVPKRVYTEAATANDAALPSVVRLHLLSGNP